MAASLCIDDGYRVIAVGHYLAEVKVVAVVASSLGGAATSCPVLGEESLFPDRFDAKFAPYHTSGIRSGLAVTQRMIH